MMTWTADTKEKVQYAMAILAIVSGLGLSIAGFAVDPTGEIDGSVLAITGELLTFAGTIFGISLHYGNELKRIKRTIERSKREKDEAE